MSIEHDRVASDDDAVVAVEGLSVDYRTASGVAHAVRDVSWSVRKHEILAIVGESGSGKSATAKAVMGVLEPSARIVSGRIFLRGEDLLEKSNSARRKYFGRDIAMVQQDPFASLNPAMTVGRHLVEAIQAHDPSVNRKAGATLALELLDLVGIKEPARRFRQYPHEFSGGMGQRVLIALAVANEPKAVIADEPTTALDVTYQAQIMNLLMSLKDRIGMSLVLITHDLALVSEFADRIAVMYGGRIMETGPVGGVIHHPAHPYTAALLKAIPDIGVQRGPLVPVPGNPPSANDLPDGCPFHPRCPLYIPICSEQAPGLEAVAPGHRSACWRSDEVFSASRSDR